MRYIINELQTDAEGQTAIVAPSQTDNYWEAESIYYSKLASAALGRSNPEGTVMIHTISMETNTGDQVMMKCYDRREG